MALIAYHAQGSHLTLQLKSLSQHNKQKVANCLTSHLVHRSEKLACLSYQLRLQPIILKKGKCFKVSSFKANSHNDGEETTPREQRLTKKTVQLSCSEKERETATAGSPDLVNHQIASADEDRQVNVEGSPAIRRLFNKWLLLLRTQTSDSVKEDIYEEKQGQEIIKAHPGTHSLTAGNLLKAVFLHFWALDATVKFPLLIFPPGYLAVKLIHGTEVAQELMPLWILGPLIVALYIQIIRGIRFLFIFSFQQTRVFMVHVLKLPHYSVQPVHYCVFLVSYIIKRKYEADMQRLLWQPISKMKSMTPKDYKELLLAKLKPHKERYREKWLDYVETIWPHYCRLIRFLKKANFI